MRGWTNLLVSVVTLVACVGITEIVLRRLADRHEVRLPSGERKSVFNPYRSDASLSYALRPGWSGRHETADFRVAVRVNELGMRGADRAQQKPAGAWRVLVLGDSYAFGWGVEETEAFPARLEARWQADGIPVEVLDAAVPGYAADQQWIVLRDRGFPLDPDLIVLASCQNDVEDLGLTRIEVDADRLPRRSESLRRFLGEDGRMHYLNEAGRPLPEWSPPGSAWLAEHSLFYTLLRYNAVRLWLGSTERAASRDRARDAGAPPAGPIDALSPAEIERGLRSGAAFQLRYHRFLVAAMRREAAHRGVPFVTVLTGAGTGALSDDCARDTDCLDLASQLARTRHPDAHLPLDGHWSARGHALAADAIDAWLAAKGMLPSGR